jgi:hypothetical protein
LSGGWSRVSFDRSSRPAVEVGDSRRSARRCALAVRPRRAIKRDAAIDGQEQADHDRHHGSFECEVKASDERLSVFVASDDVDAKRTALDAANAIGFDAVDAGPLANARLLEPLGFLNIQLGYVLGLGTQIGLKLARGPAK